MKEYLPIVGNDDANFLKVEVYYSLGGINYFTYRNEERGYYLSVCPVKKEKQRGYSMESFTVGTGKKMLLKPVKRQSAKAMAEAEEIARERMHVLVSVVCAEYGLCLEEEYEKVC